jgi:hypothetical protein
MNFDEHAKKKAFDKSPHPFSIISDLLHLPAAASDPYDRREISRSTISR